MKIPDKIKVGGTTFKINKGYVFRERFDRTAQFSHCTSEIDLSGLDAGGTPLSKQRAAQDFCHELVHVIDYVFNGLKLDEDTTERLSQGLYQVLNENKF